MNEYTRFILGWMPQGADWLVILVIALLLFGRRLPEIARSLGKSMSSFKKGIEEGKDITSEFTDEVKKVKDDVTKQAKDASGIDDLKKDS